MNRLYIDKYFYVIIILLPISFLYAGQEVLEEGWEVVRKEKTISEQYSRVTAQLLLEPTMQLQPVDSFILKAMAQKEKVTEYADRDMDVIASGQATFQNILPFSTNTQPAQIEEWLPKIESWIRSSAFNYTGYPLQEISYEFIDARNSKNIKLIFRSDSWNPSKKLYHQESNKPLFFKTIANMIYERSHTGAFPIFED